MWRVHTRTSTRRKRRQAPERASLAGVGMNDIRLLALDEARQSQQVTGILQWG